MGNNRMHAMLDSLIAAGDNPYGLSFDGVMSIPETGLEDIGDRSGMASWLNDRATEAFRTTRTTISQVAARLRSKKIQSDRTSGINGRTNDENNLTDITDSRLTAGDKTPGEQHVSSILLSLQEPQTSPDSPALQNATPSEQESPSRALQSSIVPFETQSPSPLLVPPVFLQTLALPETPVLPRAPAFSETPALQQTPTSAGSQFSAMAMESMIASQLGLSRHGDGWIKNEETHLQDRSSRNARVPGDDQELSRKQSKQVSRETPLIDNRVGLVGSKIMSGDDGSPLSRGSFVHLNVEQDKERSHTDHHSNVTIHTSHKCSTCKSRSVNPRNLVVFIDGTSMKFGLEKSNVRKLSRQVKMDGNDGIEQHKQYFMGIGAYEDEHLSRPKRLRNKISSVFEMAFAWNVDKNVKAAYGWLAERYLEGDKIYLFGFSRGAYQVRVLASMIHEVGLVREKQDVERAFLTYMSIDRYKRGTLDMVASFKKEFCWNGVRIHFVGVWDTVSSVSLFRRGVHITASATVTNACHFRHALALDERRVKFMPEYFAEVNARGGTRGDVKEVWFAGCHSDVGGANQQGNQASENDDPDSYSIHAGNVSLAWMRQEAAACGLVFESDVFGWGPHDVNLGRQDSLTSAWKILEVLPFRYQVSFSGTGKRERRLHRSRPRSVIPGQQIHSSVLLGDLYTPRATLGDGIGIPRASGFDGGDIGQPELWVIDSLDDATTIQLLKSLLSDQQTTLRSLEKVLFLLVYKLVTQPERIPSSRWSEESIAKQSGFAKFSLAVIYDITSNFSISEELAGDARQSLCEILSLPHQHYFSGTLYVLRFLTRNSTLRQHFIAHANVIKALLLALKWTTGNRNENSFPMVVDTLCSLITDADQRIEVINQLIASDGTEARGTMLSSALGVKPPSHLIASLRMITSLAQHQQRHCEGLEAKIIDLAKKGRGSVGAAAVEALVTLNVPVTRDIRFSNILGYLANTLPQLDAETGTTTLQNATGDLPPVFQANGSGRLEEGLMHRLVEAIDSPDTHERTLATLTLLKLCDYRIIRDFFSRKKIFNIFMKQLAQKGTSLLAAYALKTCLTHVDMWSSDHFRPAAERIHTMFNKGWFDDAIGRVEGSQIFDKLMTSDDLRREVINCGMVNTLMRKLESGGPHEVRMSSICLDILVERGSVNLESRVKKGLDDLKNNDQMTRKKGVKILSALAQTRAGERAIMQHIKEIVEMLPPNVTQDGSHYPSSDVIIAVLLRLFRSDMLRTEITETPEYDRFKTFSAAQRWSQSVTSRLV